MLDLLSGGRLNFGVGKGAYPKHFEGFRIAPQEMRARYEEALEIIERAWTQESFSYEGKFWQIPELSLSPKPLQKPHPPIYRGLASPEAFEPAGIKGHGALFVPWLTPETRLRKELRATVLRCAPMVTRQFLPARLRSSCLLTRTMAKHLPRRGKPRDAT